MELDSTGSSYIFQDPATTPGQHGPTTRIEFGNAGISDGYGTLLDGVNADIVAAPEPATVLMIGAGALGILVSRVRKR